jgi:hypothetical protein
MGFLHAILLILAGSLALSAVVAKQPGARALIAKLTPFQAFIGVGLLVISLIALIDVGPVRAFRILAAAPVFGIAVIGSTYGGILLGFCFGMPQIAKWLPGTSRAETTALGLSRKIAPFQMAVGILCLVAGLLIVLYELHILSPT